MLSFNIKFWLTGRWTDNSKTICPNLSIWGHKKYSEDLRQKKKKTVKSMRRLLPFFLPIALGLKDKYFLWVFFYYYTNTLYFYHVQMILERKKAVFNNTTQKVKTNNKHYIPTMHIQQPFKI